MLEAVLLGMGWRRTKLQEGRHVSNGRLGIISSRWTQTRHVSLFIGRLGISRWTQIRSWEEGVRVDIPSCQGRITTRMGPCVPALPTENAHPEALDYAWLYPS